VIALRELGLAAAIVVGLMLSAHLASAQGEAETTTHRSWLNFYPDALLRDTDARTVPDVQALLAEDMPKWLTLDQRQRLSQVAIEFPLRDDAQPLSFSSLPSQGRIRASVSSLRFLRDVLSAYAWLGVHGFDVQTITEYLCMLKYQGPVGSTGARNTPLELLGVPGNALDEPAVMARFQQLYGTALVFILGHELGHIYHQHSGYSTVSLGLARRQEEEADRFGLAILERAGSAPIGAAFYFFIAAHLQVVAGDPEFYARRANDTHPISSDRMSAAASFIRGRADLFVRSGADPAVLRDSAQKLEGVAATLNDDGVQRMLRRVGLSTAPEDLRPRRAGRRERHDNQYRRGVVVFDGTFVGTWMDAKGTSFDVQMVLRRQGDIVRGEHDVGFVGNDGANYNAGSSKVKLTGVVSGNQFEFTWRWGADHFGRGRLRAVDEGRELSGTWGYNGKNEGGGTWRLRRQR
jgi:hypothetical protein